MNLWVKICGTTSLRDAQLAVEAGADAIGFVFAPSPRKVTATEVAAITPLLPAALEKIGVFVDAPLDEIAETVSVGGLTGVQLHSDAGDDWPARLRARFGAGFRIVGVVHFGSGVEERVAELAKDPAIDAVLVDSRSGTKVGGTGIAFDWEAARAALFAYGRMKPLIAAGGLRPENVAEAVATLAPWGVDAVSGVEARPGRKDPEKVAAFVARARGAAKG